ncbi:MAG: FHA domain-containing protein [Desertifilum sp. SIO1I2]|nr:FHA domain-containing protein [Desertifilum sp. SIO1I2]
MITCPNCAHPNPDTASHCEACYTPLPERVPCPQCGASVSGGAEFCGQCGSAIAPTAAIAQNVPPTFINSPLAMPSVDSASLGTELPATAINSPQAAARPPLNAPTQLQTFCARLLHIQTNTKIELPPHLSVIHIGKPNDRIPPDVDVSNLPDAGVVSRIHADLRVEGGIYFLEDIGSTNGTYVNNLPLRTGDRYRLRPGDRISLGKGDKVSFLFQIDPST